MHRFIVVALCCPLAFGGIESLSAAPVAQAQYMQAAPSQPGGPIQKLKQNTTENFAQMKRRWSLQREKYSACRKETRTQRLKGQKTRAFLKTCMSR